MFEHVVCIKDIWKGSLEWLEQGLYQLENLERQGLISNLEAISLREHETTTES